MSASTAGQTDRDEGRLLDARSHFLRCVRDSCPGIVRKSCSLWLSSLEPRIPSIVVRVIDRDDLDVAHARVTLDGSEVTVDGRAQIVDPGPHVISAEAPDLLRAEKSFLLSEGEQARSVILTLAPRVSDPPANVASIPPPPAPVAPRGAERDRVDYRLPAGVWVLGGVGVLGLASFTYFAVASNNKYDELARTCGNSCTSEQTESGRRDAVIADVALGVGIGALVGATTWGLLSWRRAQRTAAVTLAPTSRGAMAGVRGTF